jgi:signal transduction histidine kinase
MGRGGRVRDNRPMRERRDTGDALVRLRALAEEQAALRRVATLVASDPEPSRVFQCVCEEVGTVLGIAGTNLTRFEGDGTQTVLAGWSERGTPIFPVGPGVPLEGDAAVPKVSRSGRPERVDDYGELDGPLVERIRAAGIASAVAAPIKVAGRLWGAVVATNGLPFSFPPDTEERIAGFAELVSDALANADAREQLAASRARIVDAADAERRRLERNLHDGAQQRLVSLALDLGHVDAKLAGGDPEAARRLLAPAREELNVALDELRELARGIHPAILSDRGLGPAIEALAARANVPVELAALCERLPQRVEAAAYYLVAEALTNAARHARATSVSVRLRCAGERLLIEIRDDGVGGADVRAGSGLRGLTDRVEALGGRLEIDSPAGGGTALRGDVPLNRIRTPD